MRNHFLRAGGIPSTDDGGDFITTDLKVHYDFSNTSCWNRNNSSNAADYTVNNLIDSYNDAFFRVRTNNTFQYGSDSDVINYNTAGGGCLFMAPSEFSYQDAAILIVPGSWSGSSNQYTPYYNLPTETSSHNLMDGLDDDGPFTIEMWYRVFITTSNNLHVELCKFLTENTSGTDVRMGQQIYGGTWYGVSQRRKIRQHVHYSSIRPSIPGAPATGSGWSDWVHHVFTRDDSNNFKLYIQNTFQSTITATHNFDSLKAIGFSYVFGTSTVPIQLGIFRFYKGKGLTSSEVTTNWNAQKSRFGH